jgi:BirA family biotin operon repressor/biotin-[acetyl-CoA-carboxylase] ligase
MSAGSTGRPALGRPRLHLRETDSTNSQARTLAAAGAPHGTLITAATWSAPAGRALLCSLIVRDPPRLLPLATGVAVAEVAGPSAQVKWPNDVLLDGAKVAGILVEGRPQEHWAVVGIGLNVAVRESDFPEELRGRAATLGLDPAEIEPTLERLLHSLEIWLSAGSDAVLGGVRERDALFGHPVRWAAGEGRADGIDADGGLRVVTSDGGVQTLTAGEVHLVPT